MRTKEGNIELFYNTLESSLWSLCSRVDTTHFLLLLISCTFFPPLLVYVLKCQSSFWSELKLIFFMNETRPKKRRESRKVSILWQVQQHTWKSLFHRAVKRLRTSLKTHVNRGKKKLPFRLYTQNQCHPQKLFPYFTKLTAWFLHRKRRMVENYFAWLTSNRLGLLIHTDVVRMPST